MADDASPDTLLRLMSWLSPAFPVGAFAYSHGLERAIHDELIKDRATLCGWLEDVVLRGSGWNDAVLLAEAWRDNAAGGDGAAVAELAEAMAGSRERHMETTLQGGAFVEAVENWASSSSDRSRSFTPSCVLPEIPSARGEIGSFARSACSATSVTGESKADAPISPLVGEMSGKAEGGHVDGLPSKGHALPYPIAVGGAAARAGIPLEPTLTAYLHAFSSNMVQAAVRLVPLGQRDGIATLASLEPLVLATAAKAASSTLDDLGSCTMISDILSMKHETQYSRVFRS